MNYKKTLLTTSIIAILAGTTQANDYISIISKEKNTYDVIENSVPVATEWLDIGTEFGCVKEFNAYDYPLGQSFTQNENCLQKQERTITTTQIFNGSPRTTVKVENQNIPVVVSYLETGQENFNTGIQRTEYTNWLDNGNHYACDDFSPLTSAVNLGESFAQNKDCSQDQERTKTVYNIWADNSETLDNTEIETRILTEIESQAAIGTLNFNTGAQRTEYTNWLDEGIHYACNTFTPLVSTINLGESFIQNRDCSQDQNRTKTVYDIWADNSETINTTTTEIQTLIENESQNSVGTLNFNTGTQRTEYTNWLNNGELHSCVSWSPLSDSVRLNESLVQNRDCSQDQNRTKTIYDIWADTTETISTTAVEIQTLTISESQNTTGTGLATSCKVILDKGWSIGSGVYTLDLPSGNKSVTCDMTTDGGGWTVFQSRFSNTDFNQNWSEYKNGFGAGNNFWLGNDVIAEMTATNKELYVELGHHNGVLYNARYSTFNIANEANKYTLTVAGHSGTQGDSLVYHSGKPFTTQDVDNDTHPSNCASLLGVGAWWHGNCFTSNLNGLYLDSIDGIVPVDTVQYNVNWRYNTGLNYSYKTTRMMFR